VTVIMSERMVDLLRAKLRLPATQVPPQHSSAIQATQQHDDKNLQCFLHLLSSKPHFTVPTSLSRRILHCQGVDFLDDNVANIVSLAADRFLATVLHQSMACRDRRIKGEELLRERRQEERLWRKRKRIEMEEKEERKREINEKRRQSNLEAIRAGDIVQGDKMQNSGIGGAKKKKSKKGKMDTSPTNGSSSTDKDKNSRSLEVRPDLNVTPELVKTLGSSMGGTKVDSDDASYNSLDEEVDHERSQFLDYKNEVDSSDEDDEREDDEDDEEKRFVLKLRDLQRPLEAWGVTLTGKVLGEQDIEPKYDFKLKGDGQVEDDTLLLQVGVSDKDSSDVSNESNNSAAQDQKEDFKPKNEGSNDT